MVGEGNKRIEAMWRPEVAATVAKFTRTIHMVCENLESLSERSMAQLFPNRDLCERMRSIMVDMRAALDPDGYGRTPR
jgi:hypothetical protein